MWGISIQLGVGSGVEQGDFSPSGGPCSGPLGASGALGSRGFALRVFMSFRVSGFRFLGFSGFGQLMFFCDRIVKDLCHDGWVGGRRQLWS